MSSIIDKLITNNNIARLDYNDVGGDEYNWMHRHRYIEAYNYFSEWITKLRVGRDFNSCLELGQQNLFTGALIDLGLSVVNSQTDLRYELPFGDGSFDVVVSMEVFEHISDRSSHKINEIETFRGDGLATCVAECHRVMKPGGVLFVTTPNIASYKALEEILNGRAPCTYRPHHREYTCAELNGILSQRFKLIDMITRDSWPEIVKYTKFNDDLSRLGYDISNRGDTILAICSKD